MQSRDELCTLIVDFLDICMVRLELRLVGLQHLPVSDPSSRARPFVLCKAILCLL